MEENEITKEEILKGLVFDEKATLQKLKYLVEKSKEIIMIEGHSGKVIFLKTNLQLRDKIILLCIGKYFSKELGLSESSKVSFKEIKDTIGAESHALSRPLGALLNENILEKEGDNYLIKYYQIENCINSIVEDKSHAQIIRKKSRKTHQVKKEKKEPKIVKELVSGSIAKLAEKVGMNEDELKHIFEFEENDVRIITYLEGKSEGDRQLKATLLYLVVYKFCFDLKEIESGDLRRKLQDLGIRSLVNLSTHLKNFPNFIWHKQNQIGSTATTYRITTPGEIEGLRLIREIRKKLSEGE